MIVSIGGWFSCRNTHTHTIDVGKSVHRLWPTNVRLIPASVEAKLVAGPVECVVTWIVCIFSLYR